MHLLIKVKWDTDGQPYDECRLPFTVVMLDVPKKIDAETEDVIATTLSDAFGFCHFSWDWERLSPVHDTHAGGAFYPDRLGLCRYPE